MCTTIKCIIVHHRTADCGCTLPLIPQLLWCLLTSRTKLSTLLKVDLQLSKLQETENLDHVWRASLSWHHSTDTTRFPHQMNWNLCDLALHLPRWMYPIIWMMDIRCYHLLFAIFLRHSRHQFPPCLTKNRPRDFWSNVTRLRLCHIKFVQGHL